MTKQRVKKFGVAQTSLVAAVIMFFTSLIIVIPMGIIMEIASGNDMPGFGLGGTALIIVAPFFYGIVTFIMTAISCLIYNWIAEWTGGIEFNIEIVDSIDSE